MKKIYIAGKYTNGYVIENIREAVSAAEFVSNYGWVPFIPHLTGFWDLLFPHEYEFWMKQDFEWLKSCDALLRLPGESKGADREVDLAKSLNIPVYYGIWEVPPSGETDA